MAVRQGLPVAHFVTEPEEMKATFKDCYILLHEKKISAVKDLIPLLETIAKTGKPLLIISEDIEGDALSTLVVNKLRGTLNICAVKAPGYGDRRKALMEDIAVLTGRQGQSSEDLGVPLEKVDLTYSGTRAKKIVRREGEHDDHRRRRRHQGDPGPHRHDQEGDGDDHLRLRQGEAPGRLAKLARRRGAGQGLRGDEVG